MVRRDEPDISGSYAHVAIHTECNSLTRWENGIGPIGLIGIYRKFI